MARDRATAKCRLCNADVFRAYGIWLAEDQTEFGNSFCPTNAKGLGGHRVSQGTDA